jgi:hypothetical protein
MRFSAGPSYGARSGAAPSWAAPRQFVLLAQTNAPWCPPTAAGHKYETADGENERSCAAGTWQNLGAEAAAVASRLLAECLGSTIVLGHAARADHVPKPRLAARGQGRRAELAEMKAQPSLPYLREPAPKSLPVGLHVQAPSRSHLEPPLRGRRLAHGVPRREQTRAEASDAETERT